MRPTLSALVSRKTYGLRSGQMGFRHRQTPKGPPKPRAFLPDSVRGTVKRRQKLFQFLCSRLIIHGAIRTTYPRCKGVQRGFYRYIKLAKRNTPTSRRRARRLLPDGKMPFNILFNELGPRFRTAKTEGYTTVYKTGFRQHDAAPMGIIQIKGSPRDYDYQFATMTVGRQLAIHSQGHDTARSQAAATEWRRSPLAEPVLPCNGHDLHPGYRYLPRKTQLALLKALDGKSAEECREFDDLCRYHYDRTLTVAKRSGAEVASELAKQEAAGQEVAIWDDSEPYVEGEEGFETQEEARRSQEAETIKAGKMPYGVPRTAADVGAQVVPAKPTRRPLEMRRTTPKWTRSPHQLTRGQRAKKGHVQSMPNYTQMGQERWKEVWARGKEAEREATEAALLQGPSPILQRRIDAR